MSLTKERLANAHEEISLLKQLRDIRNSRRTRHSRKAEETIIEKVKEVQSRGAAIDEYLCATKDRIAAEEKAAKARERRLKVARELDLAKRFLNLLESTQPPPYSPPTTNSRYNLRPRSNVNYRE